MKDYKTKNITYFYPKNYDFNKKKAREAENFISRMRKEYDLSESRSVIYLVGNNVDECNSFLGHDYTFASSAQKAAGLYMPAQENFRHHLILSARPDHFHELVHSVFIYNYPKAALLFHEGIATYYGGNAGRDYKALCKELDKILENNPDIDISDFDSLNMMLDDGINPMYVIGARLIDYANRLGGKEKVLTLFKYGNSDVYEALEKELGLKQSDIKQVLYK